MMNRILNITRARKSERKVVDREMDYLRRTYADCLI